MQLIPPKLYLCKVFSFYISLYERQQKSLKSNKFFPELFQQNIGARCY